MEKHQTSETDTRGIAKYSAGAAELEQIAEAGVPKGRPILLRGGSEPLEMTDRNPGQQQILKSNQELEERVAERTEQLRVAKSDLDALTYGVAHDLRTPLRHIHAFVEIVLNDADSVLSAEGARHLQFIVTETARMDKLIEALLGLSRVGRQTLNLHDLDLNRVVKEVIENMESEVHGRQIEWRVELLPVVRCDPVLLRIVFSNLLANAVKFTAPRERARIEISAEKRNHECVLRVRDNGVGFNMKYAEKLFGVFQRLHRAQDFEGTGVGLATVQRIIRKHGGRIWAEAEVDKGASFYFTLGTPETFEGNTNAMAVGEDHA